MTRLKEFLKLIGSVLLACLLLGLAFFSVDISGGSE